jgi:hypothetical protein
MVIPLGRGMTIIGSTRSMLHSLATFHHNQVGVEVDDATHSGGQEVSKVDAAKVAVAAMKHQEHPATKPHR